MAKECCHTNTRVAHHDFEFKQKMTQRLNRIEGQVRGIQNMIMNDTYCDDVLTQIAAVRSALSAVSHSLLEAHLKTCVLDQIREGKEEVMDEVIETVRRITK